MLKSFFSVLAFFAAAVALPAQQNTIQNLYDAFGYEKKGTVLDWGYSALIHFNGKTILFDAGANGDLFARNAKATGADLKKIDFAVLSHKHGDHASGFDYVLQVNPSLKLYLPNDPSLGAGMGLPLPEVSKELLASLPPRATLLPGAAQEDLGAVGAALLAREQRVRSRQKGSRPRHILDCHKIAPDRRLLSLSSQ